jgi:Pyruvate/2-oxoacid:ferredoxin oxidoreductase gamma subunit
VLSAARTVAKAAVLSGLWAAQKDDYPITVKTGHSLAGLVLAPEEVQYTGIAKPDALVLLSTDGLAKARRFLAQMDPEGHVFALPGLADVETRAHVTVVDPEQAQERIPASATALHALARAVAALGLFPFEALEETVAGDDPRYRDANLAAVRAAINAA